jgi:hypothetical protein
MGTRDQGREYSERVNFLITGLDLTCENGNIDEALCQEQQIQTDHAPLRIFL